MTMNLKTAVGTTDFTDNTDKEGIAVAGVFTWRGTAKRRKQRSAAEPEIRNPNQAQPEPTTESNHEIHETHETRSSFVQRNFASFRFPIGPFPSIRISSFGFRISGSAGLRSFATMNYFSQDERNKLSSVER